MSACSCWYTIVSSRMERLDCVWWRHKHVTWLHLKSRGTNEGGTNEGLADDCMWGREVQLQRFSGHVTTLLAIHTSSKVPRYCWTGMLQRFSGHVTSSQVTWQLCPLHSSSKGPRNVWTEIWHRMSSLVTWPNCTAIEILKNVLFFAHYSPIYAWKF